MERLCIVGTAPSWAQTPWTDAGLHIVSLNDAYRMPGFVRADAWYDFHPLNRFFTVPKGHGQIYAHQVPPGYYVRPDDHLAWLARQSQTIPVWLHPEYRTQLPEAATWPQAHPFPKEALEAEFGRYFTSSPAWMMAHAISQGVKELWITGIHLSTEHEYIEQRPNFEYLAGRFLGSGKLATTTKDGFRHFETAQAHLVLPESSPVVQSDFQYAFQPRPRAHLEPLKWDAHRFSVKRERAVQQLRTLPPWKSKRALNEELAQLDALIADTQEQIHRVDLAQQIRMV